MRIKLNLASGWKFLCGILGIIFLVILAKMLIFIIGLSVSILSAEVILFRLLSIFFLLLIFLPIIIFSGFMAYFYFYKFLNEQLTINKDGIEHDSFGYKLRANWTNAKSIKAIGILGQINGIYVIPDKVDNWLKLPTKWLVNINQQGEYFVPLSMFDINWRDSELGQQIKQYVPHLFENKQSV